MAYLLIPNQMLPNKNKNTNNDLRGTCCQLIQHFIDKKQHLTHTCDDKKTTKVLQTFQNMKIDSLTIYACA